MLNQGTISYKAVIEKMQRDTGFTQFYEEECKEWLWEVMSIIGLSSLLVDIEEEVTIEDYRGILPINLESILGIKNKADNTPLIQELGIYSNTLPSTQDPTVTRVVSDGVSYTSVDGSIIPDLSHTMVDTIRPTTSNYGCFRYDIKGHYIYIDGMKDGTIIISYKAFPIEDNAPVIPNDAKILEMCALYIASKIAKRLMYKGELSPGIADKIDQEYMFYAKSARIKALTPDYNMMEAMKMRMGLIPDTSRFLRGFSNKYK